MRRPRCLGALRLILLAAVLLGATLIATAAHSAVGGQRDVAPNGFAPAERTMFAPVLALAPPGPKQPSRAIDRFDRWLQLQRRIMFHPQLDPALQALVDRLPPRQSTLIRAAALYSRDDIPWQDEAPDTHFIAVAGRPENLGYHYTLAPGFTPPVDAGQFAGRFALRPPPGAVGDRKSVLGEIQGTLLTDSVGLDGLVDMFAAALHAFHGTLQPPWNSRPGSFDAHDRALVARLQRDLPEFTARARRYVRVHNVLDELEGPDGPLVFCNVDASVNAEALQPYPNLQRFYRRLIEHVTLRSSIRDAAGREWLRFGFDRGRITLVFLLRSGRPGAFAPGTFEPVQDSLALERVSSGQFRTRISARIRQIGMDFGAEFEFLTEYSRHRGGLRLTTRLKRVPALLAPPVVDAVARFVAGEFLRLLATGNGGKGLQTAVTSDTSGPNAYLLSAVTQGEFAYAPALDLLTRIADTVADAHDVAVRREERRLGEELFDAAVADFERARPEIMRLGR